MSDPFSPEDVAERKTRRKARASVDQLDMQWVCSDPRGRRVLARIMAATGMMLPSYVPGDALTTAYREGQRDIGIKLHAVLTNAGEGLAQSILSEPVTGE